MKKFALIVLFFGLFAAISGCSDSLKSESQTRNVFSPPPPEKITIYFNGDRTELAGSDPKFKNLSREIMAVVNNITDGVGGNRTAWPVGFEKEREPKILKEYVYIFAKWDKPYKISLNQKDMPLGIQGWEGTPKDSEGNYIIETDEIMIEIYKENMASSFSYKKETLVRNQFYWAYAKSPNFKPDILMKIVSE